MPGIAMMSAAPARSGRQGIVPITLIAPAPPPVTGQSAYSVYLVATLERYGLDNLALRGRDARDGWRGYAQKIARSFAVAARLAVGPPRQTVLIVLDGGIGLLADLIFILILRARGMRKLLLSHHSFAYIDHRSSLMAAVVRFAGPDATHLFLCESMRRRFLAVYGNEIHARVVSNARRLPSPLGRVLAPRPSTFTIGYLGNISMEKGIAEYFDLMDALLEAGLPVRGLIAGPATTDQIADFIRERSARCGGQIDWIGAVYGDQKQAFLSKLSLLAFPTKYVNEAQPNVLFEALSVGVPTVTLARGCIADDLASTGSLVARSPESFVAETVPYVMRLLELQERGELGDIASRTVESFTELYLTSSSAETDLIAFMLEEAG